MEVIAFGGVLIAFAGPGIIFVYLCGAAVSPCADLFVVTPSREFDQKVIAWLSLSDTFGTRAARGTKTRPFGAFVSFCSSCS